MDSYIHETGDSPKICIIWLHGLGADGKDMLGLAQGLALKVPVRHVALNATVRPVTINNGMSMRAWYDIIGVNFSDREDKPGIFSSEKFILNTIEEQQNQGFKPHQIFLAGFSQGGAMALFTGLRSALQLGGIISLSSYLPLASECDVVKHFDTAIFLAGGQYDTVVFPQWTLQTKTWLLSKGIKNITFHEYPIAHAVSIQEINDISSWLNANIKSALEKLGENS